MPDRDPGNQGRNSGRAPDGTEKASIPGEQARQATIILRTPLRRAIFIGGLVAIVVLGLILAVL